MDTDGSGKISSDELRSMMENLQAGLSPGEIDQLMRDVDTNGDGQLDLEEFSAMLSKWAT